MAAKKGTVKTKAVVKKSTALFIPDGEVDEKVMQSLTVAKGEEEAFSQDEIEIPRLKLAQSMTPQIKKSRAEYIEDLEEGAYFNATTRKVYGRVLLMQQHVYFHNVVIFKGKKGAGEFNGTLTVEEFEAFKKKHPELERDGGDLVIKGSSEGENMRYQDTHNFLVTLPEHPEEGAMLYSMASTGCKPARNWNTQYRNRKRGGNALQRYATIWKLSIGDFVKNGHDYTQVSSIVPMGTPTPELLEMGEGLAAFAQKLKETGVKYEEDHGGVEAAENSDF